MIPKIEIEDPDPELKMYYLTFYKITSKALIISTFISRYGYKPYKMIDIGMGIGAGPVLKGEQYDEFKNRIKETINLSTFVPEMCSTRKIQTKSKNKHMLRSNDSDAK